MRRYSDEQLIEAIQASHSWRGVLRQVGLSATSAAAMRSVRMHADRLGLDYSHFTGQRRWTDQQLVAAIDSAAQSGAGRGSARAGRRLRAPDDDTRPRCTPWHRHRLISTPPRSRSRRVGLMRPGHGRLPGPARSWPRRGSSCVAMPSHGRSSRAATTCSSGWARRPNASRSRQTDSEAGTVLDRVVSPTPARSATHV